jgi:hypothetical protein
LRVMAIAAFNRVQMRRGGVRYPPVFGTLAKTPTCSLDLKPGELVRVKSRQEILSTLDVSERNRGLSFDNEMVPFCGGTYRVLRRVRKVIDESTGRLVEMKRDCVILDGVACQGWYHELCPRALYSFWREIWLSRASVTQPRLQPARERSFIVFVVDLFVRAGAKRLARVIGGGSVQKDAGSV